MRCGLAFSEGDADSESEGGNSHVLTWTTVIVCVGGAAEAVLVASGCGPINGTFPSPGVTMVNTGGNLFSVPSGCDIQCSDMHWGDALK